MSKKLLDKIGFNCFHNLGDAWNTNNLERALDFTVQAGGKYLRPAFALQQGEFDGGTNDWRIQPFKKIIAKGIVPILNLYPQQLKGHLKDDNIDSLVEQAVSAYSRVLDGLLSAGISPNDFIIEAWNEADGGFAMSMQESQTDTSVIDKYLTFNMRMCEECHKRGIKFMDLDSIRFPKDTSLSLVMQQYNQKMANYSSKPEWVSFHPYCERGAWEREVPEQLLVQDNMNLTSWNNLAEIPLAVSEYGYPSVEWGHPFSGVYPTQYARDMMIRQTIILDYLNIDPIVVYSANTNPDPQTAGSDDCWGTYQYHADTNEIDMTELGKVELNFFQSMAGFHLNGIVTPSDTSSMSITNSQYSNFAFEYENDEGRKKLFYWNPFGANTASLNWNGQDRNLTFNQHVKVISE